jgi:DNA-binding XRE family transcriptional regulator
VKKNSTKLLKLKYWREKLELSQDDMATLLGCKRPNYCKKERGTVDIRRTEMLSIQKEFNKRLTKLKQPELTLDDIFE